MSSFAFAMFLLTSQVSATQRIVPDWDALTDFTATYTADMHNVLALDPSSPIKSYKEHGTINLDLFHERLSMKSAGSLQVEKPHHWGHAPQKDAKLDGDAELIFDALKGTLEFKGNFAASSHTVPYLNGDIEFCVKLHFPKGLLPPGAYLRANFEQRKPRLEAMYAHLPPHEDVTIDGESVALIKAPMGHGPHGPVTGYVGLRHNGAPFGLGIVPPYNGKWDDIYVKFPTWSKGAGTFTEFSCTGSASTSAAELVANEYAMQQLKSFDAVMENLRTMDQGSLYDHFLVSPSVMFEDAAAMELNSTPKEDAGLQLWVVVATGGAAGMAACLAMFAVFKLFAKKSAQPIGKPLLGSTA